MPIVTSLQPVVLAGIQINGLDLGYNPIRTPAFGQTIGDTFVEGQGSYPFRRGSKAKTWPVTVWLASPNAIGGYAAGSQGANEALARQLEELAGNPDCQPAYIKWSAFRGLPHDGWYLIGDCQPDYTTTAAGRIRCTFTLTLVNPGSLRRMGQTFIGGALPSTYTGSAIPWVAFPVNSTVLGSGGTIITRAGSEGNVPVILNPLVNPAPAVLSATQSDWWLGGCHVYDTMLVGGNIVPTTGAAINANWLEVFGTDHVFVGDVVVTNTLQLLRFQAGASGVCTLWYWNPNGTPAQWQQYDTLYYQENNLNTGSLRQVSLKRVGLEEVALEAVSSGPGQTAVDTIRLPRGAMASILEFRPQSQANTNPYGHFLRAPASLKAVWTSGSIGDPALANQNLAATSDVGYAAALINNVADPFVSGWLYQNAPANQGSAGGTDLGFGESGAPSQNQMRRYAIFATPLLNPQNYQAEAESGTLGTGWSSVADAGASGGNAAKAASGTASGNADLFGTAFALPAVTSVDVYFRVRVTSNAGSTSEMTLGLWDATSASFAASTTYKANQAPTSYGASSLLQVATNVTPVNGHTVRFRAVTAATLGTDWFIDEAFIVLRSDGSNMPLDLWQQMAFDRKIERAYA